MKVQKYNIINKQHSKCRWKTWSTTSVELRERAPSQMNVSLDSLVTMKVHLAKTSSSNSAQPISLCSRTAWRPTETTKTSAWSQRASLTRVQQRLSRRSTLLALETLFTDHEAFKNDIFSLQEWRPNSPTRSLSLTPYLTQSILHSRFQNVYLHHPTLKTLLLGFWMLANQSRKYAVVASKVKLNLKEDPALVDYVSKITTRSRTGLWHCWLSL